MAYLYYLFAHLFMYLCEKFICEKKKMLVLDPNGLWAKLEQTG